MIEAVRLVDLGWNGVARISLSGHYAADVEIFPGRDAVLEGTRPIKLSLAHAVTLAQAILCANLDRLAAIDKKETENAE